MHSLHMPVLGVMSSCAFLTKLHIFLYDMICIDCMLNLKKTRDCQYKLEFNGVSERCPEVRFEREHYASGRRDQNLLLGLRRGRG